MNLPLTWPTVFWEAIGRGADNALGNSVQTIRTNRGNLECVLELNKIYCLDAREGLKQLDDESVDCVVTSPPFWALRDYGIESNIWDGGEDCDHEFVESPASLAHKNRNGLDGSTIGCPESRKRLHGFGEAKGELCVKCGAWRGCLGLEPNFDMFVKHLCDIFDEVKRVLGKTGTCWVHFGDTYGSARGRSGRKLGLPEARKRPWNRPPITGMEKSLCQVPARFAIEMTNRGWLLRNEIIWQKPNCMPSSATDRFTVDFDKVFLFTNSRK